MALERSTSPAGSAGVLRRRGAEAPRGGRAPLPPLGRGRKAEPKGGAEGSEESPVHGQSKALVAIFGVSLRYVFQRWIAAFLLVSFCETGFPSKKSRIGCHGSVLFLGVPPGLGHHHSGESGKRTPIGNTPLSMCRFREEQLGEPEMLSLEQ